jgi:rhamnosyl/mannosyltransferase
LRVLEVYKGLYPRIRGGIERYVHDLGLYLLRRGHDVEVMVPGGRTRGGSSVVEGMRVTTVPGLLTLLSNPITPGLGMRLRRSGAGVLHFHLPLPTAVLSWSLWSDGRPYVVTYHSDIVRQSLVLPLYRPLLLGFLRRASSVLATSPVYAGSSPFLADLDNVRVAPIGVDTDRFSPGPGRDGDYFLFVGRFRSYKGIDVLLEAWEDLTDSRLVMVGGGPLEDRVRRRVEDRHPEVELAGTVDDAELLRLYRGARALILPSTRRSEAYGMVQLEAMACGTPVISTSLDTGVRWVNRDGVTGLTVPPGDPAALAGAVRRMTDDGLRSRLSRNALDRARGDLEASVAFAAVERALEEAR